MGLINHLADQGKGLEVAFKLAQAICSAAPKSVQITKKSINRSYELARMKEALLEGLEADIKIESDLSPERIEFNRIRKNDGLKAALLWRDGT